MAQDNRPLSPHLTVYKPQITSVLSILHRGTGVFLSIGTIILLWWLTAIASGAESYATVQAVMGSWIGLLALFGWSFSLFYHLCNGVRHLIWDAGYGFKVEEVERSGKVVLVVSAALTVAAWLTACLS